MRNRNGQRSGCIRERDKGRRERTLLMASHELEALSLGQLGRQLGRADFRLLPLKVVRGFDEDTDGSARGHQRRLSQIPHDRRARWNHPVHEAQRLSPDIAYVKLFGRCAESPISSSLPCRHVEKN